EHTHLITGARAAASQYQPRDRITHEIACALIDGKIAGSEVSLPDRPRVASIPGGQHNPRHTGNARYIIDLHE
ncbi:hypothetical protein, partial [Dokdonella sp.]|uniref:hypothetical protein n=1 Tax=Dokdonella sp. TaxID=2291710 RepID=UPI003BAE1A55